MGCDGIEPFTMPAQILFGLLFEVLDIRHRRSGIYLPWVGVASRSAQMRPTQRPKVASVSVGFSIAERYEPHQELWRSEHQNLGRISSSR